MNFFIFTAALILFRTAVVFGMPASVATETLPSFNITLDHTSLETEHNLLARAEKFNAYVVCETSSGSPWTRDVLAAADTLLNKAAYCRQKNPLGTRCTQMTDYGSAAIGICGPFGSQVHCKTAGKAAQAVAERCSSSSVAGGLGQYEWGTIVVYTT